MGEGNEIAAILVILLVDGEHSLFIFLSEDGCINRIGNGSIDRIEREMFIGKDGSDLFKQLRAQVTAGVIHFLGQRLAAPEPKGKLCELSVIFEYADGREAESAWRYGSESQGPPRDIRQFVTEAVRLTDPWYEKQKHMTATAKKTKPWWRPWCR